VVTEHGEDRNVERGAGVREHRGLCRLTVSGQVSGQQHQVGGAGERRNRGANLLAPVL
jgi:hypothetical protein